MDTMSDHFGAVDYVVFIGMLMVSTIIGLYYAWKDRNNTDEDEFLRGGKHMSILPVTISIMASFLPSTAFIGFPTVVYATGTMLYFIIIPAILAAFIACELFIPYLQILANISALLCMIPFFGVELFAPSIALSIVTDMSITSSILVIGFIVTIYTSLGGLKGVIWTDFFQFCVMIIGLMAVVIRGANISGGMANVFERAHAGGRIEFWNMDFDIYSTSSFWVMMLGFIVLYSGTFSTNQMQIQRVVCMPSLRAAKRALYFATPGYVLVIVLCLTTGVMMFARYYDCCPLVTGRVKRPDQMLPFFVLDIFEGDYPGLPGMFVALVFGSSLSTLSSGLNAMASIIWDDYARKVFHFLPDKYSVYATKLLAILIGIVSISMAFVAKETQNIVEAAIMLYGASNGPLFGLFCLGLFFPWANAIGGAAALIVGQIICFWITIGSVSDKRDPTTMALALTTVGCDALNITYYSQNITDVPLAFMQTYKVPRYHPKGNDIIHHISPFFVPFIGFFVSLIVGNIVSLATKGNKDRRLDKNLINITACYYLEKLLPESWRQLQNDRPVRRVRDGHSSPNNQPTDKPMVAMRQLNRRLGVTDDNNGDEDQEIVNPLRNDQTANIYPRIPPIARTNV
ncbi:unnamed protein product [Medioppia subpectinata]|uniref:Sodium-coupled monocarboxylate transporter 1 n=1 Tax=Medioppia subpectinata TaxID=1979941 RepID=A0A7R9KLF5_9ACAR|nr:unnamed protein product [Medioppia subpectinata]CAG2105751.1 unnamed protein product [Medioppia subpectinata]